MWRLKFLLLTSSCLFAQSNQVARHVIFGTSLPATCSPKTGDIFFLVNLSTVTGLQYNCASVNTWVPGGIASFVAKVDATTQAANIALTTLYTVPSTGAGFYRASCWVVVTQAATSSSTMPSCQLTFTDNDTSQVLGPAITPTSTGNTVGSTYSGSSIGSGGTGSYVFNVKASSTISYSTSSYASSGATPMQYAIHIKLEYLGN